VLRTIFYDVTRTRRLTPFTMESVILIATATLAPILPLMPTMMNAFAAR